jgi:TatD DNase family protein
MAGKRNHPELLQVERFTHKNRKNNELMPKIAYQCCNSSLKTEENLQVAVNVPLDRLMLETDGPWCDIRPTHASFKHLSKMTPEQQAMYIPPSKKKEKFEFGLMVKNRNEPCTMG